MHEGRKVLCSLFVFGVLLAMVAGRARADEPKAEAYERVSGGPAVELSTGGIASGSFQGGILLGASVHGYVGGLFLDTLQEATSPPVAPSTVESRSGASRLGVAVRATIVRTADGRVSLFGAIDGGLTTRNVATFGSAGSSSFRAEGTTWSIGPGLRFWLTDHLSLAYLTRLRFTHLSGSAGALPDVAASMNPDAQTSADYQQLEGVFQVLCVF